MAQTFTADGSLPFGQSDDSIRMIIGTLSMADGGTGSSVATGLEVVYGAHLTPKSAGSFSQYPPVSMHLNSVAGEIKAISAGSGDVYYATVWGR